MWQDATGPDYQKDKEGIINRAVNVCPAKRTIPEQLNMLTFGLMLFVYSSACTLCKKTLENGKQNINKLKQTGNNIKTKVQDKQNFDIKSVNCIK